MTFIRSHLPSPAMLVAVLALVVASAGSATAATMLTGKQIKNGTITGADVKNHSLTARDFRGHLRGPRGLQGPAGPAGPAGATTSSALNIVRVDPGKVPVAAGTNGSVRANCPAGTHIIGGGFELGGPGRVIYSSDMAPGNQSWTVGVDNTQSALRTYVRAIAYCVS